MSDHSENCEPIAGDPKLTAFALGELSAAERAELAAAISGLPDEQQAAEIARCGELVRRAARTAALPPPSPELRQAVLARFAAATSAAPARVVRYPVPPRRLWLPLSLAASVLVLAGATWLLNMRYSEQLVADRADFAGGRFGEREEAELGDVSIEPFEPPADETIPLLTEGMEKMERTPPATEESHSIFDAPGSMPARPTSGGRRIHGLGENRPTVVNESPERSRRQSQRTGSELGNISGGGKKGGGQRHNDKPVLTDEGGGQASQARDTPEGAILGNSSFEAFTWKRGELETEKSKREAKNRSGMDFGMGGMGSAGGRGSGARIQSRAKARAPEGVTPRLIVQEEEDELLARDSMRAGAPLIEGRRGEERDALADEAYALITENPFLTPADHPLSTFSIDVDTASYANIRRYINAGSLPPPAAVRIEELVNYFPYDYPQPEGDVPFSATTEVAGCPWASEHRLLRVGLKGREVPADQRPASNLVFLLDVSGSMDEPNKLPLVKEAMQLLTDQLTENDRVAIVVYAGTSGLVLPPTNGSDKHAIRAAIAGLSAGGSTNGGQGLQTAYAAADRGFIRGGTNRVILATDGDFNVGVVDRDELVRMIEERAVGGVQFTALGFGVGNLKDATLEQLADKGNGNYAYIDTLGEARKVLVEQLSGTMVTIAKDVKIQIEFNPARVAAYRLIGYENRLLRDEDFNDDRKDAGDVGAGHTVTALYELVPAGAEQPAGVDELKYQRQSRLTEAAASAELLTLKLRYKEPDGRTSRLWQRVLTDDGKPYGQASGDFKFAAAVAAFGMLLRGSEHAGNATFDAVLELAAEGLRFDPHGYRSEFLDLVRRAKQQTQQ